MSARWIERTPEEWGAFLSTCTASEWAVEVPEVTRKDLLLVIGGKFAGTDFSFGRNLNRIVFGECDFTGAKFGRTFSIRKLGHIEGNRGVIVIPKILVPEQGESKDDYQKRQARHNFPFSIIAINAANGISVFRTAHPDIDTSIDGGTAERLDLVPWRVWAALKAEAEKAKWEWDDNAVPCARRAASAATDAARVATHPASRAKPTAGSGAAKPVL